MLRGLRHEDGGETVAGVWGLNFRVQGLGAGGDILQKPQKKPFKISKTEEIQKKSHRNALKKTQTNSKKTQKTPQSTRIEPPNSRMRGGGEDGEEGLFWFYNCTPTAGG